MLHATTLVDSLKRELKARGITYADLAGRIKMSEASVKRMFSQKNFTLQRLDQVLQAAGIEFGDLTSLAHDESQLISQLTYEQEREIIGNPKIFVVAVSVLNLITVDQITRVYDMTEAEVVKHLLRLDKIGFLQLQPNNRVKLLVSRTFHWIPNGPIQNHFRDLAYRDYLTSKFDGEDEIMQLVNVMLSKQSIAALLSRLKQLAREFSQLHQDEMKLPYDDKTPISILVAARPWMPESFKALVRKDVLPTTIGGRK
ncbi:MAG TPA: helix-turn-helix domain-containing protein [Burkholderiaceae bacterium]|jgi:transcriptional regulator with XRE-family HTH domain